MLTQSKLIQLALRGTLAKSRHAYLPQIRVEQQLLELYVLLLCLGKHPLLGLRENVVGDVGRGAHVSGQTLMCSCLLKWLGSTSSFMRHPCWVRALYSPSMPKPALRQPPQLQYLHTKSCNNRLLNSGPLKSAAGRSSFDAIYRRRS